jgi:uncharacterized membrane protein YagU involved in acid resistance
MASVARIEWGPVVLRAFIAGIAGGIALDLFIYLATVLPHHGSMIGVWQFIASTALGKVAFTSTGYAWFGLLIHFIVSIAWAAGYGYLAVTQPGIAARPVISGLVYGFVVWGVMQMVLYSVQALHINTFADALLSIIGHTVFFGLPVALVTTSQLRSHAP